MLAGADASHHARGRGVGGGVCVDNPKSSQALTSWPGCVQNVLLTEHGRAKVADVGLARMVTATQSYASGGSGEAASNSMLPHI